jgi:hypothetical protein
MIDMLAQTIGAKHEAAGSESALMQALDCLRVLCGFRQYGEGKVVHDWSAG